MRLLGTAATVVNLCRWLILGMQAWVIAGSIRYSFGTHRVGTKQANKWGLFDMHGNLAEWCEDRYNAYSNKPVSDPNGGYRGDNRVRRGGSWLSPASPECRSASRYEFSLERGAFTGLTLALDLQQ